MQCTNQKILVKKKIASKTFVEKLRRVEYTLATLSLIIIDIILIRCLHRRTPLLLGDA